MNENSVNKVKNSNISKLIKIYNESFNANKQIFYENFNPKDYMYLINNYHNLNNTFIANTNIENNEKINIFINLVLKTVDDFKFEEEKVWAILYSYNLYRLYGFKINELTSTDMGLLISIYMSFDENYSLKTLDEIMDFIFDANIKKEIYDKKIDKNKLVLILLEPIDFYLNEGVKLGIPINYFIKEELKNNKNSNLSIRQILKLNWDTPENIYNNLKNDVTNLANIMINSEDKDQKQEGYELISNLEMLVCRLKNIPEQDYDNCVNAIKILFEDEKIEILDKYYLIFSLVNQFTTYGSNKNIK